MSVVIAPGPPPSLDLHGPLTSTALQAALSLFPPFTPALRRHSATHHSLTLPPPPFPAGPLVDLLTSLPQQPAAGVLTVRPAAGDDARPTVGDARPGPAAGSPAAPAAGGATRPAAGPVTPVQHDLLLDTVAHPGHGLHVGQVHWRWRGPLDTERFAEAWQYVFGSEAVLRAALGPGRGPGAAAGTRAGAGTGAAPGAAPAVFVHAHAAPEIVWHPAGSADWPALLASERRREFDVSRPGPLRIALVDEGACIRILVTHHQAFVDGRSMRLLLDAFYRAYLADGRPMGGERRPDLRDHLQWLSSRDLAPARAYWARATPPRGAATLPARPGTRPTGGEGHGVGRRRLTPYEAARLRDWAASHGAAESTALHAVWALLLHRATGERHVAFAVASSGRGIALDSVERLPGPLQVALPRHAVVEPRGLVTGLLADLTGSALDAAAYEWVSPGQIHAWAGRAPFEAELTESLLAFEPPAGSERPHTARANRESLSEALAEEGVRVDPVEAVGPYTGAPFSLSAGHDGEGGLMLTAVHDRARISDCDAAEILAQTARLMRELPAAARESTTVAEALALLDGAPVPHTAARPSAPLRTLRAPAHPGAGTVCLIPPPGAPPGCYDAMAQAYPGPQALTTLSDGAPADAAACLAALRPALAAGPPLVLGCFSGAAALAAEVAGRIAEQGWQPPLVAVAGTPDGGADAVRELARTLMAAVQRRS
ncbi:condensation domain-containing protein [Streptomyces sp. NPDC051183]|uniref:condensation domain-containing protein n=1 Tax=Streptomyces sp. NPDC051183 TaxID=3155165 RepID=UPI0034348AAE